MNRSLCRQRVILEPLVEDVAVHAKTYSDPLEELQAGRVHHVVLIFELLEDPLELLLLWERSILVQGHWNALI